MSPLNKELLPLCVLPQKSRDKGSRDYPGSKPTFEGPTFDVPVVGFRPRDRLFSARTAIVKTRQETDDKEGVRKLCVSIFGVLNPFTFQARKIPGLLIMEHPPRTKGLFLGESGIRKQTLTVFVPVPSRRRYIS